MNKETNTIVWEKWFDPFGYDDIIESSKENNTEEYGSFYDDEEKTDHDQTLENAKPPQRIRVMSTPMGIIPLTEHTSSGKIFNFWVGHSNFNITPYIAAIIEQTEGVETLDIYTRYRFRIGVGKAFEDSIVMREINKRVYSEL